MNSFRHMQLHAGGSQNTREPLVRSESHRVSKVAAAALDRVPLVRPSSAGAARTKGRFHELKKSSAGGSAQQLAERNVRVSPLHCAWWMGWFLCAKYLLLCQHWKCREFGSWGWVG